MTVVPICRPRKTSASNEMFRCSPMTRNRGHRWLETRPAVSNPSAVVAVSSRRVTMPAALVAYHRTGPLKLMGPLPDGADDAVSAHEPCGQPEGSEPVRCRRRPDNGRGARRVGVDAGSG